MNDKQRKAMFAKKNNSSLSSKDIVSHQKKFGISTKGTVGLNRQKPKEVIMFNKAINDLEKLNQLFKNSVASSDPEKVEDAYDHSMLGGAGGIDQDWIDENDKHGEFAEMSHMGIIGDEINFSRVENLSSDENDRYKVNRIVDELSRIGSEMGNFAWDNQHDTPALKEELKEHISEIDKIILNARQLTKGY